VAGEAGHQQPRRSGDARCGDHHKGYGDAGLDGTNGRSSHTRSRWSAGVCFDNGVLVERPDEV
jgi:hypothetical protein